MAVCSVFTLFLYIWIYFYGIREIASADDRVACPSDTSSYHIRDGIFTCMKGLGGKKVNASLCEDGRPIQVTAAGRHRCRHLPDYVLGSPLYKLSAFDSVSVSLGCDSGIILSQRAAWVCPQNGGWEESITDEQASKTLVKECNTRSSCSTSVPRDSNPQTNCQLRIQYVCIYETSISTIQKGETSIALSASSSTAYITSPDYPAYSSVDFLGTVLLHVAEGGAFLLFVHHTWIAKAAGQCSDRLAFISNNMPSAGCCGSVFNQTDPDTNSCRQIQNMQMNEFFIQWISHSGPNNEGSVGFLIEITVLEKAVTDSTVSSTSKQEQTVSRWPRSSTTQSTLKSTVTVTKTSTLSKSSMASTVHGNALSASTGTGTDSESNTESANRTDTYTTVGTVPIVIATEDITSNPTVTVIIICVGCGLFLLIIIILISSYIARRRKKGKQAKPKSEPENRLRKLEKAADGRLFQHDVTVPGGKDGQLTDVTTANNNVNAHGSTENGIINENARNEYVNVDSNTARVFMEDVAS